MLELSDVTVRYGKHLAVDGVSLSLDKGEIVVVLGANGAGKSSLLKAISGMVPIASKTPCASGSASSTGSPAATVRAGAQVLTNLPAHKVSGVEQAITAAGARLLYLPPYSPDFNPIEMAFSKLKALLRKAAVRTIPELWEAIAKAIDEFPTDECRNYFAAAGYDHE